MSFDALRYIASHPDLIAAFGANTAAATAHYNLRGAIERRAISFDPLQYLATHADLAASFGSDTTAATLHYITTGIYEGRASTGFDILRYIASYPDLITAFGTDTAAAARHYMSVGRLEGRSITGFDPLRYIASHPDLIAAFGTDTKAATTHFITAGIHEGRSTAAFDPDAYLAQFPDLRNAFGSDLDAASRHYITTGVFEGRSVAATLNLSETGASSGAAVFVINGQSSFDRIGNSIASAGDVNGDGLEDLIVGASGSSPAAGTVAGRSYVVFGKTDQTGVALSAVANGTGGFVINGQCASDLSGSSVSSAGDINGDGLGDLIVGAYWSDPAGLTSAGRSYVVFGRTDQAGVNLSAVAGGTGGFVINGQGVSDWSGISVCGVGDVDGDGLADLIVGAPFNSPASGFFAGRSYVVFGKTGTAPVNLSEVAIGIGGFVITGQCALDQSGRRVASAGDVNGDGLADLIVGARNSDPGTGLNAGRSYLVFGKSDRTEVQLSDVVNGTGGFVINGQCADDYSGTSVAGAGDLNGDGLADLIVGADLSDPAAGSNAGRSYVVFGKADQSAVALSAVANGTGGFVINGHCGGDFTQGFGGAINALDVAVAGDVNGDGLSDLIVGIQGADSSGRVDAGRSYLVFGKADQSAVNLSAVAIGIGGFVINGQFGRDYSGARVASGGDVNGDGLSDLIIGARGADPSAGRDAGRSYVIFGGTTGVVRSPAGAQLGDSGNNQLTGTSANETLVGGAGDDTLVSGGGADVLYGGAGNDVISVNASAISALAAPFGIGSNTTQLARIDGGTGIDTLKLEGANLTLDLTTIANQGSATPGSSSRLESIERIDLTGSGNNTLVIGLRDVIDLASFNTFNNATGWADGTYDLATGGPNGINPEQRRQLLIDADTGDTVQLTGWTAMGTVTNNGNTYTVYHQGGFAELLIDTRASVVPA